MTSEELYERVKPLAPEMTVNVHVGYGDSLASGEPAYLYCAYIYDQKGREVVSEGHRNVSDLLRVVAARMDARRAA